MRPREPGMRRSMTRANADRILLFCKLRQLGLKTLINLPRSSSQQPKRVEVQPILSSCLLWSLTVSLLHLSLVHQSQSVNHHILDHSLHLRAIFGHGCKKLLFGLGAYPSLESGKLPKMVYLIIHKSVLNNSWSLHLWHKIPLFDVHLNQVCHHCIRFRRRPGSKQVHPLEKRRTKQCRRQAEWVMFTHAWELNILIIRRN